MTRFKTTATAAALLIGFVPLAQAYEVAPAAYIIEDPIAQIVPVGQRDQLADACALPAVIVLSHILALPDDVRAEAMARPETELRCAAN